MLLLIDDSSINVICAGDLVALNSLKNLLIAYKEKKHILFIEHSACNRLVKMDAFDAGFKSIILHIKSKIHDFGTLFEALDFKLRVGSGTSFPSGPINRFFEDERINIPAEYRININWFNDTQNIQHTVLLSENIEDSKMYARYAEAFLVKSGVSKLLHIRAECAGGGGTSISEELLALDSEGRTCTVLIDGDKVHSNSPYGDLAENVKETIERITGVCFAYAIDAKEHENIIPDRLVDRFVSNSRDRVIRDRYSELKRVCEIIGSNYYSYADLRGGMTLCRASRYPELFDHIHDKLEKLSEIRDTEYCSEICSNENECDCELYKGISDSLLRSIHSIVKAMSDHELNQNIDFQKDRMVAMTARIVAAACCAQKSTII